MISKTSLKPSENKHESKKDIYLDPMDDSFQKSCLRLFTAYHEAGHAITALVNYIYVDSITIEENNTGNTFYSPYSLEEAKKTNDNEFLTLIATNEIKLTLAGLIAEKHFYKSSFGSSIVFPSLLRDGSWEDNAFVNKTISKYNIANAGKERTKFKKVIKKEVYKDIKTYWSDIVLISHLLLKSKSVKFSKIQKLLTTKSSNQKFWNERLTSVVYIYDNLDNISPKNYKLMAKAK